MTWLLLRSVQALAAVFGLLLLLSSQVDPGDDGAKTGALVCLVIFFLAGKGASGISRQELEDDDRWVAEQAPHTGDFIPDVNRVLPQPKHFFYSPRHGGWRRCYHSIPSQGGDCACGDFSKPRFAPPPPTR